MQKHRTFQKLLIDQESHIIPVIVRNATIEDIPVVANLERVIERENSASEPTLLARYRMFPEGFFIAEENYRIAGYAESCLWDKKEFKTFEEIREFPKHHDKNGKTLYVIFLAVDDSCRKRGIGSRLMGTCKEYAENHGLNNVQLVAREELVGFYNDLGFKFVEELPDFLPHSAGVLMEYETRR